MRIHKRLPAAASIAFVLSIFGCGPSSEKLKALAPDAPVSASVKVFDALSTGSTAELLPLLDESLSVEELEPALTPLLPLFSGAQTREYRFGSWKWLYQNSESYHQVGYEVKLDDAYVVANLVFKPNGDELSLAGLHYKQLEHSLIEFHEFTVEGKSGTHFFFLLGGVATPLLVLSCMVSCWRRRPRRRWLWLIFIPLSFPVLSLNWSTGELSLQLLAFNLFGAASFQGGLFEPMRFQLAIPVGALAYLIARPATANTPPDDAIAAQAKEPQASLPG